MSQRSRSSNPGAEGRASTPLPGVSSSPPAAGAPPMMNPATDEVAAPDVAPAPPASAEQKPAEISIETGALLGVISSGASLLFTILRSKITALYLGPAGMGRSAQILQLVAMVNIPVTMVTGPALVSGLAEAKGRGDRAQMAQIIRTAITVALSISTLTGLLAVV